MRTAVNMAPYQKVQTYLGKVGRFLILQGMSSWVGVHLTLIPFSLNIIFPKITKRLPDL